MIHGLLAEGARAASDAPLAATPERSWSYGAVLALAERIAGALGGLDRAGIYAQDSPELLALLCACARAGCEPCVLNRGSSPAEVAELRARFAFPAVFTDAPTLADARPLAELFTAQPPAQKPAADPRVCILTTGTTGPPKGARYRWASLCAQARRRPEQVGSRWLLAYHLNHFAGMQMLVHVLVNRAILVIPASAQLSDAIAALVEQGVEYASATPTFWRFVLSEVSPAQARALPLKQLTLGGEASSDELVGALAERFPQARISQVFAATEVGSLFSVTDRRQGFPAALLEPRPGADVELQVRDGELFVRARHGMLGYAGEPEQSEPAWRSTGDLVEVRDGRVRFVGRASETINVGGVKVNPLPVEEVVQRVPGVLLARAYGQPNPVTGRIVAVDVVAAPGADATQLEQAIRAACRALPRASQPRAVHLVAALDTANRKLVRRSS